MRKTFKRQVGTVCGVAFAFLFVVNPILLGSPIPVFHYESLPNAVEVLGWSEDGLKLADGRVVMPQGMRRLPGKSNVLSVLVKQGVQVEPDGDVFGRVSLSKRCGNDPTLFNLHRINIGSYLAYAREGEFVVAPTAAEPQAKGLALFPNGVSYSLHNFDEFQKSYLARLKSNGRYVSR